MFPFDAYVRRDHAPGRADRIRELKAQIRRERIQRLLVDVGIEGACTGLVEAVDLDSGPRTADVWAARKRSAVDGIASSKTDGPLVAAGVSVSRDAARGDVAIGAIAVVAVEGDDVNVDRIDWIESGE